MSENPHDDFEKLYRDRLQAIIDRLKTDYELLNDHEHLERVAKTPEDRLREKKLINELRESIQKSENEYKTLQNNLETLRQRELQQNQSRPDKNSTDYKIHTEQPTTSKKVPNVKDEPSQADFVDVGIVIALQEEFDVFFPAIQKSYKPERDPRTGHFFFLFEHPGSDPQKPYRCVASFVGRMGHTEAALMTARMISRWNPRTVVMLGIAAGIHEDAMLGDVIVADSVDSYIDRGKIVQDASQVSFSLQFSGQVYQCSADLIKFVSAFRYVHLEAYNKWRQSCSHYLNELIEEQVRDKLKAAQLIPSLVSYKDGPLASGPLVVASKAFKQALQQRNRSFLAVEMEAGGMMAAIRQEIDQKRSLVLRGISDYGDERKEELDKIKGGAFRQCAMYNAMQLLWKLLEANALPYSSTVNTDDQT